MPGRQGLVACISPHLFPQFPHFPPFPPPISPPFSPIPTHGRVHYGYIGGCVTCLVWVFLRSEQVAAARARAGKGKGHRTENTKKTKKAKKKKQKQKQENTANHKRYKKHQQLRSWARAREGTGQSSGLPFPGQTGGPSTISDTTQSYRWGCTFFGEYGSINGCVAS